MEIFAVITEIRKILCTKIENIGTVIINTNLKDIILEILLNNDQDNLIFIKID